MVGFCVNPKCGRELRYLRDGRVYLFEVATSSGARRAEHFWLCGKCSSTMKLNVSATGEVKLLPSLPRTNPYNVGLAHQPLPGSR
jgi:hypothetical protein